MVIHWPGRTECEFDGMSIAKNLVMKLFSDNAVQSVTAWISFGLFACAEVTFIYFLYKSLGIL